MDEHIVGTKGLDVERKLLRHNKGSLAVFLPQMPIDCCCVRKEFFPPPSKPGWPRAIFTPLDCGLTAIGTNGERISKDGNLQGFLLQPLPAAIKAVQKPESTVRASR